MTTIVKRIAKGSTLTVAELDANVTNLNNTKLETTGGTLTGLPVLANQDVDIISPVYPTTKPSLNLDFTRGQLDPRITFVRNNTATYYDGQTTAKAEENLFSYSQDYSNVVWVAANGGSKTSTTKLAPDGTSTALTVSLSAQYSNISHVTNSLINGTTYTISFYARRDSGTNVLSIFSSTGFSIGTYTPTATWIRYTVSFTWSNPTTSQGIHVTQDRNTTGFSDVDIWGVQLEQRSSVTAYTPTTTTAITNYIPVLMTAPAGVARFDCDPITGKSLGLLIEESRTNLFTYSSDFSNAVWTKYTSSIITNYGTAPDGTLSANQFSLVTGASAIQGFYTFISATAQAYTHSIYIKPLDSQMYFALTNMDGLSTSYNLTTLAVTSGEGGTSTGTITSVGDGWYRITRTVTATAGFQYPIFTAIPSYPRTGGSLSWTPTLPSRTLIWGAQFEAGSFATSYIPTVASTVTRAADQDTQAIQVNVYTGSIKLEFIPNHGVSSLGCPLWSSYIDASNYSAIFHDGTNMLFRKRIAGTNYDASIALTYVAAQLIKVAVSWSNVNINIAVNGVLGTANTNTLPLQLSSIQRIGALEFLKQANNVDEVRVDGGVKNAAYYPIVLSTSNLVALTS